MPCEIPAAALEVPIIIRLEPVKSQNLASLILHGLHHGVKFARVAYIAL